MDAPLFLSQRPTSYHIRTFSVSFLQSVLEVGIHTTDVQLPHLLGHSLFSLCFDKQLFGLSDVKVLLAVCATTIRMLKVVLYRHKCWTCHAH